MANGTQEEGAPSGEVALAGMTPVTLYVSALFGEFLEKKNRRLADAPAQGFLDQQ
jgi:hypothetical protein